MIVNRIRVAHRAEPFCPFVICLSDGRRVNVTLRELMMLAPSGRFVFVVQPDETFNIVDVAQVTRIELEPVAATR